MFENANNEIPFILSDGINFYNIKENDPNLLDSSSEISLFHEEEIKSFSPIFEENNVNLELNIQSNANENSNERKYIPKKRKKGKPRLKGTKNVEHTNSSFDNLQRKIQVHFFSFIIDLSNKALKQVFKNIKASFKQINQQDKITVNYKYFSYLKELSIKALLRLDISKKYKRYKKTYNKDLLLKIEGKSKLLDYLFNMNYLDLFNYYYNNAKPLCDKIINFGKEEIQLSPNIETFFDLIERPKNKELRQELINTAKTVYFNGDNCERGPIFLIK